METHWPSLQVKDPDSQEVTFTLTCLLEDLAVQATRGGGSLGGAGAYGEFSG